MSRPSLIVRDSDIQAAVEAFTEADPDNYLRLQGFADFYIYEDGHNPYSLIEPIIVAGAKMEFNGDSLFEATAAHFGFYFVGRKDGVLESIRQLTAPQ